MPNKTTPQEPNMQKVHNGSNKPQSNLILTLILLAFLLALWEIKCLYSFKPRKKPPQIKRYPHKEERGPAINRSDTP